MSERQRKIVVFYTYKGGIGRSMCLVNCAFRLAVRHGLRVAVVDWDLEAPSLDQYFNEARSREEAKTDGVLEYLLEWHQESGAIPASVTVPSEFKKRFLQQVLREETPHGEIWLMKAGRSLDEQYTMQLKTLLQKDITGSRGSDAIEALRGVIASNCDIALVDSRTGLTDIGLVCTTMVPDALFMLTAANEQSWNGLMSAASNARPAQPGLSSNLASRDERDIGRTVWLGVSRVPLVGELELTGQWLYANKGIFEDGVRLGYWDEDEHPDGLKTFLIPHNGRWTVGQRIVRASELGPDDYLSLAYDRIAAALSVWHRKSAIVAYQAQEPRYSVESIAKDIEAAMKRRDHAACAQFYYLLGASLYQGDKVAASRRAFESAALLALGRQDLALLDLATECLSRIRSKNTAPETGDAWDAAEVSGTLSGALFERNTALETEKKLLLSRSGLPGPDEIGRC